ncbi:MAG: PaaI family thioesterase [Deltaproteobacteria bacterium]|nr:PaaI family thioesterase [Deltaproteobacteria bacterium]
MKTVNPDYVKAVSRQVSACPYFHLISMEIEDLGWGWSRLMVEIGEEHLQPFGMVHGGVFSSLIDAAAFWAVYPCLDEEDGMTTVEMKLNYLSPAAEGRLVAEGSAVKVGRTLSLGEASVTDGEGRILAHGTATLMRIPGLRLNTMSRLPPKFLPPEL